MTTQNAPEGLFIPTKALEELSENARQELFTVLGSLGLEGVGHAPEVEKEPVFLDRDTFMKHVADQGVYDDAGMRVWKQLYRSWRIKTAAEAITEVERAEKPWVVNRAQLLEDFTVQFTPTHIPISLKDKPLYELPEELMQLDVWSLKETIDNQSIRDVRNIGPKSINLLARIAEEALANTSA